MDTRVIFTKKGKLKKLDLSDGYNGDIDIGKDESSEEDDVFIQDPTIDINGSLTKPLMHPRQRTKVKGYKSWRLCRLLRPILCFLVLTVALGSLMATVVYFVNKNPGSQPDKGGLSRVSDDVNIIGCSNIAIEDVWIVGLPKLITESAIRLVDVNKDGVLDIIIGFGTGADGYNIPDIVCDIYFNGTKPCHGGLLALEGKTGKELWRHYSPHELYAVNCNADLDDDGVMDCLGAGRAGAFQAVSGKEGRLLWDFGQQEAKNDIMNLYTAQYIEDLDGDNVLDVLITHGGDPLQKPGSGHRLSGRLLVMSGRTGKVLKWVGVPDEREVYYSPQVYRWTDHTPIVLFGTGGETHPGALWYITLNDLYEGKMDKAERIYWDHHKGIMTPPVLLDLTGDGVEDIVMSMFNSTVLAIDGQSFKHLWNYSFPMSESYSTPAPGFYNNDSVPDFLVKFSFGPGFPLYYHAETTILDGRTGESLLEKHIVDSVGAQASPITVSVEGHGNDIFLYWIADCLNHEGKGGQYKFLEGTNVHEQSRSDFCRLRFKTNGFSKMYALSSRVKVPGVVVYFSEDRKWVERNAWINTTEEALSFVRDHPEHLKDYLLFSAQSEIAEKEKPYNKYKKVDSTREQHVDDTDDRGYYDPSLDGQYYDDQTGAQDDDQLRDNVYNALGSILGDYPQGSVDNMAARDPPARRRTPYTGYYAPLSDNYGEGVYKRSRKNSFPENGRISWKYDEDGIYRREDKQPGKQKPQKYIMKRKKRSIVKADDESKRIRKLSEKDDIFRESNVFTTYKKLAAEKLLRFLEKDDVVDGGKGKNKRRKRHVGPHDEGGLQRLLSTGTIAPTTLDPTHPDFNHTVDIVFATYWFFPAKTQAILPEDQHCIEQKMSTEKIRFDPKSKYYGMDHDAYEHEITHECLEASKHQLSDHGTYESQTSYNPFNVHMGQMSIYRIRITCTCSKEEMKNTEKRCSKILPFDQQQWAGYMGSRGDSHWLPRDWNYRINIQD